ncbi:hypothetical protein FANTH_14127 [Fusarium anthophilum]|uniref:Nephrocystin 3-like N-terminal domain-containing protein n=1 Tax=Fusarium anthophilum TaxID=48485 RepID=A0A8H4YK81_9HYPO|nr:hypothetical protein FANTH_14127 [Fusarium anthophilum]
MDHDAKSTARGTISPESIPSTGLSVVYEPPNDEPVVDIIMVHGLKGHPYKTWRFMPSPGKAEKVSTHSDGGVLKPKSSKRLELRNSLKTWIKGPPNKDCLEQGVIDSAHSAVSSASTAESSVFWPADLLPQLCKNARILTFGYDTKMLALSWASETAFIKGIVECTAAIIFLGTPHRGSPELSAIGEWARSILDTFHFQTTSAILDTLGLKTTDLERAHEAFSRLWLQYDFRVKTFQEGFGLTGIKLGVLGNKVVPHDSSLIGDSREHAETLQANHMEMSRFSSSQDPNFIKVAGEIAIIYSAIEREQIHHHLQTENFRLSRETSSAPQYDCRDQRNGIDKKMINTVIESLRFDAMNTRRECISPPSLNTGQWLFQDSTFLTWKSSIDFSERLLFIKGKPGAGKSTLMKEAVRKTKSEFQARGCCASFFINARGDVLEGSVSGIFTSLLFQLLTYCEGLNINSQSYAAMTVMENIREKAALSSKAWSDREIESLLTEVLYLLSWERVPVFIFVDALDELDIEAGRYVVTSWKNHVQVYRNTRVCLSCRHFPNISTAGYLELVLDAHNRPDILTYINLQLRRHIGTGEKRWRVELADMIFSMSAGVFLWVVLIVDTVCANFDRGYSLAALRRLVKDTPTELKEVYAQTLGTLTAGERMLAMKLFQWVTEAKRPLRLDEWHHVLGFIADPPPKSLKEWRESATFTENDHQLERMIKTLSRGLLEISNCHFDAVAGKEAGTSSVNAGAGSLDHEQGSARVVQVIHQSVNDFLISEGGFQILGWTGTNTVAACHSMIAVTCLDYMNITELDDLVFARQLQMIGGGAVSSKRSSLWGEPQDLHTREASSGPKRTLDGLIALPRVDPQKFVETWMANEQLPSCSSSLRDAIHRSAASGSTGVKSQALQDYPALLLYAASALTYHIIIAFSSIPDLRKAKLHLRFEDKEMESRLNALHTRTGFEAYLDILQSDAGLSSNPSTPSMTNEEIYHRFLRGRETNLDAQIAAKKTESAASQGPRRPRSIASFGSASSYEHGSSKAQNG